MYFSRLTPRIPRTVSDTTEHIRFYVLRVVFLFFYLLFVDSVRYMKQTYASFRAQVKVASHVVAYVRDGGFRGGGRCSEGKVVECLVILLDSAVAAPYCACLRFLPPAFSQCRHEALSTLTVLKRQQ